MATIAIPIEIKVREFHGKLYLASQLAEAGHKVALGDKSHMRGILFDELKPDIYISKKMCKGGNTLRRFKKIKRSGGYVTVLDAEGGLGSSQDSWFQTRVWEDLLEYVDGIFAWGDVQVDAVRNNTTYPPSNIYKTGNPRFDLLQPELRGLYSRRGEEIRDEFGDYILINTNFGRANPYSEERLQKVLAERDIDIDSSVLAFRSRLLEEFLSMIEQLNNLVEEQIIVRPHPGENHDTYHSEFGNISGIHVEHSGDVRHWIMGADAIVHNNCTTGVESALLNKNVIAYEPDIGREPPEFSLPNYLSMSAETTADLVEQIDQGRRDNEYTLTDDQKAKLKTWLVNVDTKSAPKIVDAINSLCDSPPRTTYASPSLRKQLKIQLKRQPITPYIQQLRGKTKQRSGKTKQKIPELTLEEVHTGLRHLNANTSRVQVSRVNYIEDVFWIDGSHAAR